MATATELERTPGVVSPDDSDVLYETVNGQRVELPPMGAIATVIASVLEVYLGHFAMIHKLGWVISEMLFRFVGEGPIERRPDLAFVSYDRWPHRSVPEAESWSVVPDLAVEVISPTNRMRDIIGKIREYFHAGVRLVWVILPDERQVYVYESPTHVRVLGPTDELHGEPALPGFRLALATLFDAVNKPE